MVLIFMNLLIGLTVSSIDELKKTGTIMQAQKRVDDILLLSKILPKKLWPDNLMSTTFNLKSKVCSVHRGNIRWSVACTNIKNFLNLFLFFRYASECMRRNTFVLINYMFLTHIMIYIGTMKLITNTEGKSQD